MRLVQFKMPKAPAGSAWSPTTAITSIRSKVRARSRNLPKRRSPAVQRSLTCWSRSARVGAGRLRPAVERRAVCCRRSIIREPARFLVTGTGLTHTGSADARNKMHVLTHGEDAAESDSLKIFRMGIEGGKPGKGKIRRSAGMVLQGRRHLRGGARRSIADARLRACRGGGSRRSSGSTSIGPTGAPAASAMRSATSTPTT